MWIFPNIYYKILVLFCFRFLAILKVEKFFNICKIHERFLRKSLESLNLRILA